MWLRDRVTEWPELRRVSERYSTARFRWSDIFATNQFVSSVILAAVPNVYNRHSQQIRANR